MNFISSIYLWLLPLISIPLLIYLFNRRKLKDIHFSSLIFLNKIKDDSIKKINITNILLLIIRTLIILFFIIMMSRPTYSSFYKSSSNAEGIVIIAVDNSISMSKYLNNIKHIVKNIASPFGNDTKIKIVTLGENETIYKGKKIDIESLGDIKIKETFKIIDSNSIKRIINDNSENLNTFLFIITDGQDHFLNPPIPIPDKENFHIHYIYTSHEKRNLSINKIDISNKIILPNNTFKISATIQNNGSVDIEGSFANLVINDIHVGKQLLNIEKEKEISIEFEVSIPIYGEHLCQIEISEDDILEDNIYYFTINIQESINIDIISNKSNIYLENALSSFNADKDIVRIEYHNLNSYLNKKIDANILFILGMDNISNDLKKKIYNLENFSYFKIVVIPEIDDKNFDSILPFINNKPESNRVNYSKNNYLEIESEKINDIFLSTLYKDNPIRNIKIFNYIEMDSNQNTLIRLKNNKSLLNRFILNDGKVDLHLLSISFDLQSSDWPLKGSIIPFIQYLITSKNLLEYSDIHKPIKEIGFHRNSQITSPLGNSLIFSKINEDSFLNKLGFYKEAMNSYNSYYAVNLGEEELLSNYIKYDDLVQLLDKKIILSNTPKEAAEYINNTIVGNDLWKIFLYLVTILVFFEIFLTSIYIKND